MGYQFPFKPNPPKSCSECSFLTDGCGGLHGKDFDKGCFSRCVTHCVKYGCDMVCPNSALLFADYCEDVGGLGTTPKFPLLSTASEELPVYMPQIHHGSSRSALLDEEWVSVPLYAVTNKDRRGRFQVRFKTPEELRNFLKVAPHTKIIITGVGPDQVIEDFWESHITRGLPAHLAALGIVAMTTPNYSFMRDVPRHNSLYNLTRIFRIAERLSEAGIAVIPHLNASNDMDWHRWLEFYREQVDLVCGCVEYQTGACYKEFGNWYFSKLVDMRDKLGRAIHPIALGGSGRFLDFENNFPSYTIIDSTPFMKTMKRQELIEIMGRWKWHRRPTKPYATLNGLLVRNIRNYRWRQMIRVGRLPEGQMLLPAA